MSAIVGLATPSHSLSGRGSVAFRNADVQLHENERVGGRGFGDCDADVGRASGGDGLAFAAPVDLRASGNRRASGLFDLDNALRAERAFHASLDVKIGEARDVADADESSRRDVGFGCVVDVTTVLEVLVHGFSPSILWIENLT
jgi:hypothetical protein